MEHEIGTGGLEHIQGLGLGNNRALVTQARQIQDVIAVILSF